MNSNCETINCQNSGFCDNKLHHSKISFSQKQSYGQKNFILHFQLIFIQGISPFSVVLEIFQLVHIKYIFIIFTS